VTDDGFEEHNKRVGKRYGWLTSRAANKMRTREIVAGVVYVAGIIQAVDLLIQLSRMIFQRAR
jgi:hypothetical protein